MPSWLEQLSARWKPVSEWLQRRLPLRVRRALITGSGIAEAVPGRRLWMCSYTDIPGFPQPSVAGHPGRVEVRWLEALPVLVFAGRCHVYEGASLEEVVAPVVVAWHLGVQALVLTNAAGSLTEAIEPGSIMLIRDVLNVTFRSLPVPREWRQLQVQCLSAPWRQRVRYRAAEHGIWCAEGVYAAVLGPSYETPAEVRMLRLCGADAVGMSTVHELVCATALGLHTLALSVLTNWAAGLQRQPLSHSDVLEMLQQVAPRLRCVLMSALQEAPVA